MRGAVLLLLFCTGQLVAGQGLARVRSLGASQAESQRLASQYFSAMSNARNLRNKYASISDKQRAACAGSGAKASMCGALSASDGDVWAMATSPAVFSWTDPATLGGGSGSLKNPFGPVGDQGSCWTCVSFAVTAMAEAAVARKLNVAGGSVRLSVQDVAFCPEDPREPRFCLSQWSLLPALAKFQNGDVVAERCLAYTAASEGNDDAGSKCKYKCKDADPQAAQGKFSMRMIRNFAQIQRHIRMFGGVATGVSIYSDFRPFFEANPTGVYEGKACAEGNAAKLEENHAVVLVGYDNVGQFWIARNSWGPGFADKGYFRIKYGVCGVANVGEMYGLVWTPNTQKQIPVALTPDPDTKGCYVYRAKPGDSIGMLADTWGVEPAELLYNNTEIISDLEKPIAGKLLSVCGLGTNVLKAPSWAGSEVPQDALGTAAAAATQPALPAQAAAPQNNNNQQQQQQQPAQASGGQRPQGSGFNFGPLQMGNRGGNNAQATPITIGSGGNGQATPIAFGTGQPVGVGNLFGFGRR